MYIVNPRSITKTVSFFVFYILLVMLLQSSPFFLLCLPLLSTPTPSGNPHTIVHVHGSCIQVLWLLHLLFSTVHPHGYSVTTYLYFLIPSPLQPFPHTCLPSGKHQSTLTIHDSVSVLLGCLVYFLESIVDRYVLIAILLFIVLIFF